MLQKFLDGKKKYSAFIITVLATMIPLFVQEPEAQSHPVVEQPTPFDPKAFHEDVLANVQATYKETNQATIFYKARDKGSVTDCQHISQAVDYWNYLVDLAVAARDWLKEQTEKKKGEA